LTIEVIALKNGKVTSISALTKMGRSVSEAITRADWRTSMRNSAAPTALPSTRNTNLTGLSSAGGNVVTSAGLGSSMLTASSTARIERRRAAGATLRIYQIQPMAGRTEFRFDLECPDPNININETVRLRDEFKRDVYVTEVLKNIETAWFRDGRARDRFMLGLRSLGEDMARALLPERLRRALWANRHRIAAVQVLSEDTSIPWELMFLSDPDAMEVDGEGFLAEYGMIRWLHDTPWPPRQLFFRSGRVRYVVPAYPVEDYVLPDAEKERQELQRMFPGATALETESVALASQLRRPGPIDVLHVSGHGDSSSTAVISANLLMAGRIAPDGRYEEDPLADSVVRNQLAFDPTSHPLVFLNCCRAGRTGNAIAGIGGFAGAFLKPTSGRGAGAFVGAQWSVGDNTALSFATSFYQALLDGKTLVDATRAARGAAKSAGELSWLAYTVYGDPLAVRADAS
jgi:CHAT domain-containing protein